MGSLVLASVLVGSLAFGGASDCRFASDELAEAINGDPRGLAIVEDKTPVCYKDFRFFMLASAICFGYPRSEEHWLKCAQNLTNGRVEGALPAMGYAIYLHSREQCGSASRIIYNLRLLEMSSLEVEKTIYLKAVRYGDLLAADRLARRLRDTKDPGHLRMASQIVHFLSLNPAAKRLAAGDEYLAKMLPPPDTEDLDMAWIADVPASTKGLCAEDSE